MCLKIFIIILLEMISPFTHSAYLFFKYCYGILLAIMECWEVECQLHILKIQFDLLNIGTLERLYLKACLGCTSPGSSYLLSAIFSDLIPGVDLNKDI